uniref:Phosphotransferase n=1 Tax=Glossina brevipalpis TaxID=37001 RepID=A0A1A9WH78_9MUSC
MPKQDFSQYVIEANCRIVKDICKPFILNDDIYMRIKDLFLLEVKKGLGKYTHKNASVKCFMTFVEKMPSGCERGKFLALELGGDVCRVLCINLQGDEDFKVDWQNFDIPINIKEDTARHFFDFLAKCLSDFVNKYDLQYDELSLGFTFAFPLKQIGINKGILVTWTKGYNVPGVVGNDVIDLLQQAIDRRGDIPIKEIVILNNTTGTLISCGWKYREAKIGVVISTGCNMCYLEKTKHIHLFKNVANRSPTMVINCESGAFGNDGILDFMRTSIDFTVDKNSTHPGKQIFEKMVAGLYLGEIVRLTVLECINAGAMLKGIVTNEILTPMTFKTLDMTQIEAEQENNFIVARKIFKKLGYTEATNGDCENLRYICATISTRSANLVAACLACLVERIGDPYLIIGADGSVYRSYPNYPTLLSYRLRKLVRPECKFDVVQAEDGSGRGAALLAASTRKRRN